MIDSRKTIKLLFPTENVTLCWKCCAAEAALRRFHRFSVIVVDKNESNFNEICIRGKKKKGRRKQRERTCKKTKTTKGRRGVVRRKEGKELGDMEWGEDGTRYGEGNNERGMKKSPRRKNDREKQKRDK